MNEKDKPIASLPNEFASEEEAGEFWDAHSLADYEEALEPADVDVAIERRHYEIEVDEESFLALRSRAHEQHKPVKQLASEIIRQTLATGSVR